MLYNFIIAIHLIVSMVLILVILMQAGRGSGLNEMFGGSQTQTIFGTSASNFLVKATAVCAVVFIITCMTLAIMSSKRSRSLLESTRIMPSAPQAPASIPEPKDVPADVKEPVLPK